MTKKFLPLLVGSVLALGVTTGCSNETNVERIEAKAEADLSKMKASDVIDYLNVEAAAVTDILEGVTDEATAKAAVEDLRKRAPKLNAAFKQFENMNEDEVSFALMRKIPKMMQTQAGLVAEVGRIYNIPEARAVLEAELEALDTSTDNSK